MAKFRILMCAVLACALLTTTSVAVQTTDSLKAGKADLKSAGPIAFGPNGVLFVGDSIGGAIFALDTQDRTASQASAVEVTGMTTKIAALLGTAADQIQVNDVAVNPVSKKTYVSVSRGLGPDAAAVIVRVDPAGTLEALSLDNIRHASTSLPNPVNASAAGGRGGNQRLQAITDLAFVDNRVFVAGLSNEEFASTLRAIPYPFAQADKGTSVEIWHASHNRFETNAPIRTFLPYKVNNEQTILASYTCTPLVKVPVASLKPGSKVMGTTIAEFGAGNTPLDMIAYSKGGQNFILMSNNRRGIMKFAADGLEKFAPITTSVPGTGGVPYETIQSLTNVVQMDLFDSQRALVLTQAGDLRTVALP
ncbi:MAG TPA: hypothetical protein VFR05_08890 [Terriglobia bacterium]|nr:hypothetical protein [Terriglobia bacterium]